jgi:hypothetical protein
MKFYQLLINVTFSGAVFNQFDVISTPDEFSEEAALGLVARGFAEEVIVVEE